MPTASKPAAKPISKPAAKPISKPAAKATTAKATTAKATTAKATTAKATTAKAQAQPPRLDNDAKTALTRKIAQRIAPPTERKSEVNRILWAVCQTARDEKRAEKIARFSLTV